MYLTTATNHCTLSAMTTLLNPDDHVQIVKANGMCGESSPARCLTAGEVIIHKGQRMRVLATNKHSGKALVEPVNAEKETP